MLIFSYLEREIESSLYEDDEEYDLRLSRFLECLLKFFLKGYRRGSLAESRAESLAESRAESLINGSLG